MRRVKAYSYRSFEHFKRETFPIICSIADRIDGPIRMADLSCGPAVLEGMLLTRLSDKLQEIHLLDVEQGFLDVATEYLSDFAACIRTHVFDLNSPESYPALADLNLIVSTNAIFNATQSSLPDLYGWCFSSLAPNGLLINHQTFGHSMEGFEQEARKYAVCLRDKEVLDELDLELTRRSHHDAGLSGAPVKQVQGGGYPGLSMSVFDHLALLRDAGFVADEIWRKGTSAMLLGVKRKKR